MPDTAVLPALPAPFTPPVPAPPERELSLVPLLRAFRSNVLITWPRASYERPVLSRRLLGRRSVLLNDPAAIRQLLVEDDARFGRSPATLRLLRPLIGTGLFLSEGSAWRHQRRTLAPAFTPRAVALLLPRMRDATGDALDRLATAVAAGRAECDLLSTCQHLALEIAGTTMFSLGMRRHAGSLRELLFGYGRAGGPSALDLLLPARFTTPGDVVRRRYGARWMAFVDRLLAARRPAAHAPPDLLALLAAARDPETGQPFTAHEVRDQVATMLLAGHETTALTMFWCLVLLAQSPAWADRLAAEAAAAPALEPTHLPLARAVVDEALRLYPPAFAIVRVARAPEVVAGIALRPGDAAVVAPWVLHRHRLLWGAPDAFDPRRFLAPGAAPDRFAYLPFGAGARACIGAQFAVQEATVALAMFCARFRLALVGTRPVLPVAVVTTAPDHSPRFRLSRR